MMTVININNKQEYQSVSQCVDHHRTVCLDRVDSLPSLFPFLFSLSGALAQLRAVRATWIFLA
jgi:hypothetical protein